VHIGASWATWDAECRLVAIWCTRRYSQLHSFAHNVAQRLHTIASAWEDRWILIRTPVGRIALTTSLSSL